MSIIYFIHILSVVIWIGGIISFSFVSAPAIFSTLSKDDAGNVVARIFPTYYLIGYISATLAIITSIFMDIKTLRIEQIKLVLLITMLALTMISGLYILPKAHNIKLELKSTTVEETKNDLKKKFSTTHKISVILNMIVLLGGLVVIYLVAMRMSVN